MFWWWAVCCSGREVQQGECHWQSCCTLHLRCQDLLHNREPSRACCTLDWCAAGGHLLFSLSPAHPLLYTKTVHCGVKQSQSVLIAVIRHTYGLICDKLHSSLISGSCWRPRSVFNFQCYYYFAKCPCMTVTHLLGFLTYFVVPAVWLALPWSPAPSSRLATCRNKKYFFLTNLT